MTNIDDFRLPKSFDRPLRPELRINTPMTKPRMYTSLDVPISADGEVPRYYYLPRQPSWEEPSSTAKVVPHGGITFNGSIVLTSYENSKGKRVTVNMPKSQLLEILHISASDLSSKSSSSYQALRLDSPGRSCSNRLYRKSDIAHYKDEFSNVYFQDYPSRPPRFKRPLGNFSYENRFTSGYANFRCRSTFKFWGPGVKVTRQTLSNSRFNALKQRNFGENNDLPVIRDNIWFDNQYLKYIFIDIDEDQDTHWNPMPVKVVGLNHNTRTGALKLLIVVNFSERLEIDLVSDDIEQTVTYRTSQIEPAVVTHLSHSTMHWGGAFTDQSYGSNSPEFVEFPEIVPSWQLAQLENYWDYAPRGSVLEFLDFAADRGEFSWDSFFRHYDESSIRAYAHAFDTQFNGVVTAAGLKQTTRMLRDRLRFAMRVVKAVRTGKFHELPSIFHPKRSSVPSGFLEWNFGWQQLVDDLHEIYQLYTNQPEWLSTKLSWMKGSHRSDDFPFDPGSYDTGGNLIYMPDKHSSGIVSTTRVDAFPRFDADTIRLASGADRPLFAIWDLVPLTWIADFFAPIGTWLSAVESAMSLNVVSECFTYTMSYNSSSYSVAPQFIERVRSTHGVNGSRPVVETSVMVPATSKFHLSLRLPRDERHGRIRYRLSTLPLRFEDDLTGWQKTAITSMIAVIADGIRRK